MGASASLHLPVLSPRAETEASAPSTNEEGGSLPLSHDLLPLHQLNLAITEHHHHQIGDLDLDRLSAGAVQSLIKAYTAFHVAHDSEEGVVTGGVQRSREELSHKARQLARYLVRLADELDHNKNPIPWKKTNSLLGDTHNSTSSSNAGKTIETLPIVPSPASRRSSCSLVNQYAVSLSFLERFTAMRPKCLSMTTSEVVRNIVLPETREQRSCFVEAKLLNTPTAFIKLNVPRSESHRLVYLSHAWSMSFSALIEIAKKAAVDHFAEVSPRSQIEIGGIADKVFFWIDAFCENQHIVPPVDVDSISKKIVTADAVALALWPADNPLALQRTWCLFEIATCAVLRKKLLTLCVKDEITLCSSADIVVDIESSHATIAADRTALIEHLRSSIGIDHANASIRTELQHSIENEIRFQSLT